MLLEEQSSVTSYPTDRPTDRRAHREVILRKGYIVKFHLRTFFLFFRTGTGLMLATFVARDAWTSSHSMMAQGRNTDISPELCIKVSYR